MSKSKESGHINKVVSAVIIWILYIIWLLKISSIVPTVGNFIIHLLFLGIVIFVFKDDLISNLKEFKVDKKKKIFRIFLYFIGFLVIMLISNGLISFFTSIMGIDLAKDSSSKALSDVFVQVPYGTLFACFLTIVFYPIVEELIFRKSLRPAIKNGVLFVIITSLLSWYFQVTLLNPSVNEFVLAIQTFLNSIFMAIIYVKTNNIIYTISSRMLFNIFICIMQLGILIFS